MTTDTLTTYAARCRARESWYKQAARAVLPDDPQRAEDLLCTAEWYAHSGAEAKAALRRQEG